MGGSTLRLAANGAEVLMRIGDADLIAATVFRRPGLASVLPRLPERRGRWN